MHIIHEICVYIYKNQDNTTVDKRVQEHFSVLYSFCVVVYSPLHKYTSSTELNWNKW